MALWYVPKEFSPIKTAGHWEWPKPEPCCPPSDPNRSHIYRTARWVDDEPKKLYR